MSRILIVDDSAVIRAVLRRQLTEQGYDVVEAAEGEQALAMARETAPALVLLDVEMPGLDGYATLRAMKADPELAIIPVVFLTGRSDGEDVARGLALGAHDYLRKPADPVELLARVHVAVRTRQLEDELRERNRELERLSVTDSLTGLHNRRYLDEQLRALISRSDRHGRALSVILCDIDHFKRVNDTYGHDTGDAVIVAVAQRLAGTLRTEDVLGRWGGEEFLILLPDIARGDAALLADRLRANVEAGVVEAPAGPVSVTGSFGAAEWSDEGPDRLVAAADEALYAAKHGGRNQVSWAS